MGEALLPARFMDADFSIPCIVVHPMMIRSSSDPTFSEPAAESDKHPSASDRWYRQVAGAALAAGASVAATAQDASAEIVSYTANWSTSAASSEQQSIYFDFLTGQSLLGGKAPSIGGGPPGEPPAWAQFAIGKFGNFAALIDMAEGFEGMGNLIPGYYAGNYYPNPFKLASGANIGPTEQFNPAPPGTFGGFMQTLATTGGGYGNWLPLPSSTGYLGLRFGDGTDFNYGWAEISINGQGNLTLNRFAYETELNTPIPAGAVPEPPAVALLALGAAGLGVFRAMRKKKVAENTASEAI